MPRRSSLRSGPDQAIAVVAFYVAFYVVLDRDELLSRIAGTEPNQIVWDWALLQNAGSFGLLAIVAFISQAFPKSGNGCGLF